MKPHFNGPAYDADRDQVRLSNQQERILNTMADRMWRTLAEIERLSNAPQASVSAQLRHLRKPRFGAYIVDRRVRGGTGALHEYRVLPSQFAEDGQGSLSLESA